MRQTTRTMSIPRSSQGADLSFADALQQPVNSPFVEQSPGDEVTLEQAIGAPRGRNPAATTPRIKCGNGDTV